MQPAVAMTTDPEPHGQTVRSAARRLSFIDEAASASAWIDECRRLLADGAVVIGLRSVDAEGDGLADTIAASLGPETTRRLPASRDGAVTLDGDIGAVAILGADADAISVALLEHIDAVGLTLLAPRTARFWSNLPLYLISIPKAGTHLLFQLAEALGYKPGGPTPQSPTGGYWYYLLNTNAHTGADEFFHDELQRAPFGNRAHPFMRSPALFNYRHPLDILVSEASYFHLDGKSPLAIMLSTLSFEERIDRLIDDPWLLGTLRDRVGRFAAWLDCANVAPVSFEEMVGSPGGGSDAVLERLIWSLQLKLHIPGDPAAVRASVQKRDSATFREGRIGGWRDKLSPSALAKVRALPQDFMTRFGYGIDAAHSMPANAPNWLKRPLQLSRADFSDTPILVRTNILGHNIVAFRGRYVAVPSAAGPIDVAKLPEEQISVLPQGAVMEDVLAALTIKSAREASNTATLPTAGMPSPPVSDTPPVAQLLFTIGETEVVRFGRTIYGIPKRLGSVDLTPGRDELARRYPGGDMLIGDTSEDVAMQAALRHAETRHRALKQAVDNLGADVRAELWEALKSAQTDLGSQWQRDLEKALASSLAGLEKSLQDRIAQAVDAKLAAGLNAQLPALETSVISRLSDVIDDRLKAGLPAAIASGFGHILEEQEAKARALRRQKVGAVHSVGSSGSYNLFLRDDGYLAVPQSFGVVDPTDYDLRDRPGVVVAANRFKLRRNLAQLARSSQPPKPVGAPRLCGRLLGYNIISRGDGALAVPQRLGAIDPHEPALRHHPEVVVAATRLTLCMRLLASAAWHWLRWAYWDGARL